MYTIKIPNPNKKPFITILENNFSKEYIKEKWSDIYYADWKDWEIELPFEYRKQLIQIPIIKRTLIEKNKLIAELNVRPNITNKEWIEKQNEVHSLNNELKETKIMRDKLFDLCLKLIAKIPAENKNNSFWEIMKQLKLIFETAGIPANFILLLIELSTKRT
ncbi:hypothetical protein [endosymbiont GvMRE of Glomus versiforme]|uniref:hypothetical protein n=1 Tax=endosymbiont GvMRE of Glomus versiforme TaxID=2039283 RepID=UPI000EEF811C|nr:hypothetical protein [endosymbiont GvMRE of Glomus versiforme]RHZ36521.1 hypothetical protein GvMRE_I2g441 [endosymbiont GvMRE of Glomus versiforme]